MLNKLIKEILELCIIECKKTHNFLKIEKYVLSPIIDYILEKIKPYILIMSILFITIILLIISILFIIITSSSKYI